MTLNERWQEMWQHEREVPRQGPSGSGSDDADILSEARSDVDRMRGRADAVIDRVLSQDSLAYLNANRQTVGQ